MTLRAFRRSRTLFAAMFSVACLVAVAPPTQAATVNGPLCAYPPPGAIADQWQSLRGPWASLTGLERDPCTLFATTSRGDAWRSTNAGLSWHQLPAAAASLGRVFAEKLTPDPLSDPLVVGSTAAAEPDVVVSHNGGQDWQGATFQGAAPQPGAPFKAEVEDAAVSRLRLNDSAQTSVFLTVVPAGLPGLGLSGSGSSLLVASQDDGSTFSVVQGAAKLRPTVVTVNPVSPAEIWVNDTGPQGGAWVSDDSGNTFAQVTSGGEVVHDISITPIADGGVQILLATDGGLLRSVNEGNSWTTVTTTAAFGVRTPPDDANDIVLETATGVVYRDRGNGPFRAMTGLPRNCSPSGLQRDALIPPTFLVQCSAGAYRLYLSRYGGQQAPAPGVVSDGPHPSGLNTRALTELATWQLPGANSGSGAIAFDGTRLYYDIGTAGKCPSWSGNCGRAVGTVDATNGHYLGSHDVGVPIFSLSYDLRHNRLLVSDIADNGLYGVDGRTHAVRRLRALPYKVPSYDSSTDGLSWIPEYQTTLQRATTEGDQQSADCSLNNWPPPGSDTVSTFVAAGDGGGYVQGEDDSTIYRFNKDCQLIGAYVHRTYNESSLENDSLACDTQTFFPQPAIWIRDSPSTLHAVSTVSAYAVPAGYCPVQSSVTMTAPPTVPTAGHALVCATLANATNGRPAPDRALTMSAAGVVFGRGLTDVHGHLCLPYAAPAGVTGRLPISLTTAFAGDSSLYPASTAAALTVIGGPAAQPPSLPIAALVPPALPPAPPNPPQPNIGPQANVAPAAQPAPQTQTQPQPQGQPQAVMAMQRQHQPQVVTVTVNQAQSTATQELSMSRRQHPDVDPHLLVLGVGGALACGFTGEFTRRRRRQIARATIRSAGTRQRKA